MKSLKDKVVGVRLTKEERHQLAEAANKTRQPVSQFMRNAAQSHAQVILASVVDCSTTTNT